MIPLQPSGGLVLVADDDSGQRSLLRRWLESEGFAVQEATDGEEAIIQFKNFHPDIILMDALMPVMGGFEASQKIKTSGDHDLPFIIVVTALGDQKSIDAAFNSGADDFITKPVHLVVLRYRLRRLIAIKQAQEALYSEVEERIRAEATVREERQLLRTLIDQLPDYIFVKDTEGRFVLSNTAHAQAARVASPEELVGETAAANFPTDLAAKYAEDDQEIMRTGVPLINAERESVDAQGKSRTVLTTKVPLRDDRDKIVGLVGISRDITNRKVMEAELTQYRDHLEKLVEGRTAELSLANAALQKEIKDRQQAEVALQKSEEHLRRLTDNMLDIICQTDAEGIIEYASPSCWNVLGYSPDELCGKSIYELVYPEDNDALYEGITSIGRVEHRYLHHRGDYIWLETLSNLLFGEDYTVKGIVLASRDITDRKRAERELQDLNRLKTEFLSTAAHELRTPLTSILGFSEILITRQLDVTRQARYLSLIREQSIYLGKIIDDLLDVSRLEAKRRLSLTMEQVNLAELITETATPFAETSARHRFVFDDLSHWPTITGDRFRLSQVCKNLLSNAVKYSPKGGDISIKGRLVPGYFEISFTDSGIGMTPEQMTHLFEKFYRADASNTAVTGTGLGLAICKLIIELHGGDIWADSRDGTGTTFTFRLPLEPVPSLEVAS